MKLILILGLVLSLCAAPGASVLRKPLVEEMTSTICTFCDLTDSTVYKYESAFAGEVCVLKWHTSYGNYSGKNPFYTAYPKGMKRLLFLYPSSGVPLIVGNGNYSVHPNVGLESLKNEFNQHVFNKTSPFAIQVTQQIVGDSLECIVTVTLVDPAFDMANLRLGIAISEREIHFQEQTTAVNATSIHTNVVRATVPEFDNGAPSISLPAMSQNEVRTFMYRIAIDEIWNREMLQTTAFIQDITTKEVFQSGVSATPASVTKNASLLNSTAYPNPTSGVVNIAYALSRPSDVTLTICDATGTSVFQTAETRVEQGKQVMSIDASHLPSGSYYYRLQMGDIIETRKIVMRK